jgi:hypothetical protein
MVAADDVASSRQLDRLGLVINLLAALAQRQRHERRRIVERQLAHQFVGALAHTQDVEEPPRLQFGHVNGAAIFLKSGARKFPSLAGWRSAMGVIGASVLWRTAATLQGRGNGIGEGVWLEPDHFGQEVGVLA